LVVRLLLRGYADQNELGYHEARDRVTKKIEGRVGKHLTPFFGDTRHKAESVFRRYDIVSEGDMRGAASKLDAIAG
jgi:hypothetical protein